METSRKNGKYCLIFDKTSGGNCEVFFRYKATLVEFHKLSIAVTLGSQTKADVIERLRKNLVNTVKSGDTLVLFVDKIAPDFKVNFSDKNFPTDKVFNFGEWRKKEVYKSILKGDEDVDVFGNKGWYEMKDEF